LAEAAGEQVPHYVQQQVVVVAAVAAVANAIAVAAVAFAAHAVVELKESSGDCWADKICR
jgi:ribosomal protein L18E